MLTWYLVLSTLMLIFLAVFWLRNDIYNLCIKIIFVLMAIFGTIVTLQQFGFIIQATQG